jgi:hypothetical protein
MVSSEPSNLWGKMSSWRDDIQSLVKKCWILAHYFIPKCRIGIECLTRGYRVHVDRSMSGYARTSERSLTSGKCVTCRGLPSHLEPSLQRLPTVPIYGDFSVIQSADKKWQMPFERFFQQWINLEFEMIAHIDWCSTAGDRSRHLSTTNENKWMFLSRWMWWQPLCFSFVETKLPSTKGQKDWSNHSGASENHTRVSQFQACSRTAWKETKVGHIMCLT